MSRPEKFTKIPVTIEGWLFDDPMQAPEIARWCGGKPVGVDRDGPAEGIEVPSIDGTQTAMVGDYVLRGMAGEFYPCKPDLLGATYKPAGNSLKAVPSWKPAAMVIASQVLVAIAVCVVVYKAVWG